MCGSEEKKERERDSLNLDGFVYIENNQEFCIFFSRIPKTQV
jgi:hypothetical protein